MLSTCIWYFQELVTRHLSGGCGLVGRGAETGVAGGRANGGSAGGPGQVKDKEKNMYHAYALIK